MPDSLEFLPSISLDEYIPSSAASDVVVTASNRLAREIRARFARNSPGFSVLLPQVTAYSAWLQDCWKQLRLQAVLTGDENIAAATALSENQEELLWDRVLRQAGADARVLFLDDTVQACLRSASLADQYKVPWDDEAWQRDEEGRVFHAWHTTVREECARRHLVRGSRLPGFVAGRIERITAFRQKRFLFAGFEEPTPAQIALIRAVASSASGTTILEAAASRQVMPNAIFRAADVEEELRGAASWAAEELARNPSAKVAVVVPDLAERRALAAEIFDAAFLPEGEPVRLWREDRPFDISLGERLAENPVASAALALFPFLEGRAEIDDARYLLRNPHFAHAHEESEARALLELTLGKYRRERVSIEDLKQAAIEVEQRSSASLAKWKEALLRLEAFDAAGSRAPSAWAESLRSLWVNCLWLGDPSLSSAEFQARHRTLEELGGLADLDLVAPVLRFNEFRRLLSRRFDVATFQPETAPKPILVAGLFEVSGLQFDAVWVCGLTDGTLPRPIQLDPFIPAYLQREHGLPRSAVQRESLFSRRAFNRLLQLAPKVILSFPARQREEQLEPSPYVREIAEATGCPIVPLALPAAYVAAAPAELSRIADWNAGTLAAARKRVQRGSRVLEDQSACPFRAFARTRLRSEAPEAQSPLMNRMDQGQFVHKALELFWRETQSHESLEALSENALESRIVRCVEEALNAFAVDPNDAFADAQRQAERIRLAQILRRWMVLERARLPFKIVETEKRHTVDLGSIELQLRPDRIDEMPGGALALIDYKTGLVKRSMWDGERPEQPQLLLYLTAEQRPVDAIAFASLKAGHTRWEFYAHEADTRFIQSRRDATPQDGWQAFVERSNAAVTALTQQFREGFSPVDPLQGAETCKYCDQHPFCRIAESATLDSDESAGEEVD